MKDFFAVVLGLLLAIAVIGGVIYVNYRFDVWKIQQYRGSESYQLERIANALEKLVEKK